MSIFCSEVIGKIDIYSEKLKFKFLNMANSYQEIEKKWQKKWSNNNIYTAFDCYPNREKSYILVEFPFPSGASLHVGHCFRYTVPDIYSRFLRMSGKNVMFPIGWDAFGLPTEEFARKTGKNPKEVTKENIQNLKTDLQKMGYSFDWGREISTTNEDYYKWTQWIFAEFYKAGLGKQSEIELWWCPEMGTVLANEEIEEDSEGNKVSERGGHPVFKKVMRQWILKMPEYAEDLLSGLEQTDFPEFVKDMQKNWIGKSQGLEIEWEIS
jgi:leucyl-tRNA synthetase